MRQSGTRRSVERAVRKGHGEPLPLRRWIVSWVNRVGKVRQLDSAHKTSKARHLWWNQITLCRVSGERGPGAKG